MLILRGTLDMALINCPECNKEISDKSKACIHCGFPLETNVKNTKCNINGKEYDLSFIFEEENKAKCIGIFKKMVNCGLVDAKNIIDNILEKNEIPRTITVKQVQTNQECANNMPKCPKCGSINIQVVPRKWSLLAGFMTNKVDRVCVNCKCKF